MTTCLSFPFPPCQYEEGKKRRKPNYSSVDLSEVEWEDRDDVVSDPFQSSLSRAMLTIKESLEAGPEDRRRL